MPEIQWTPVSGSQNADGTYQMNEVSVGGGGGTTKSTGNTWTNLLTGENFTGIANIISAIKGNGVAQQQTFPAATTPTPNNNIIFIIIGLLLLGLLAWFLFKKK